MLLSTRRPGAPGRRLALFPGTWTASLGPGHRDSPSVWRLAGSRHRRWRGPSLPWLSQRAGREYLRAPVASGSLPGQVPTGEGGSDRVILMGSPLRLHPVASHMWGSPVLCLGLPGLLWLPPSHGSVLLLTGGHITLGSHSAMALACCGPMSPLAHNAMTLSFLSSVAPCSVVL